MKAHLEVEAPSATTVSYVVTSKKRPKPRALVFIGYALRLVIVFHIVLLNLCKAQSTGNPITNNAYTKALFRLTIIDGFLQRLATGTEWWVLGIGSAATLWLCLRRPYTGECHGGHSLCISHSDLQAEESLLVLQGLGIQTSTSSPYFFVSPTTTFIPTTRIQDIVIHEAFKSLEVRFYLAVIVEGATEVVVVFPNLLPRLDVLQEVWRGARRCLYANTNKPG